MSVSAIYNLTCDMHACEEREDHYASNANAAGALPDGWIEVAIYDSPTLPPKRAHLCPVHQFEFTNISFKRDEDDDAG